MSAIRPPASAPPRGFAGAAAIVTGGASGMGAALCRELARRGARVTVADRDLEGAQRVAAEITATGGTARAAAVDVAQAAQVRSLIDASVAEHGRLDYLFNNAGIGFAGDVRDTTLEQWRQVVEVNLMGVIHGVVAAYPLMAQQGWGHIVNTASGAGTVPFAALAPYCAAKFGVVGLSTALRQEAAPLGVRVSVVCPGSVATGIFRTAIMANLPRERFFAAMTFRQISSEEAAAAILAGVERNRGYIVFPAEARRLWWLYRLSPALFERVAARQQNAWRTLRGNGGST
jgi:NAD(P)-dependent dehydrogenase (short-subunit alcohol dehydrogenase family)